MVRWHSALVLAFALSVLSGCQSGPWAANTADSAVAQSTAPVQLDPRITQLEQSSIKDKLLGRKDNGVSKEYQEAKKSLTNAEKLMLVNAEWLVSIDKPGPLEEARQKYMMILKDNPASVDAMLGLARVDHKSDRLEDAESLFRTALHKFPNHPDALAAMANFLNETDRADESIRLLASAVQTHPEDRALREKMGVALVKVGRPDEAIPHFTKCVGTASALYNVGYLLNEQQDYAAAEQYLRRALERNPELESARNVLAQMPTHGNVQHASSTASQKNQILRADGQQPR